MDLLEASRQVRVRAWVPYSRFKVGAAIRAESGAIYQGCNVENVAYALAAARWLKEAS